MACTNDLTPIIIAIATIITVQTPILVAALMNSFQARRDRRTIKAVGYETRQKVDELTLITKNGFHGPPGPKGETGKTGETGATGASENEH